MRDMSESAGNDAEGLVRNAILIAGPTASGKSALALELAHLAGGTIVNADSMQVYSVLNVLTARPQSADLRVAPHYLYGHVDPGSAYSTGRWLADVRQLGSDGVFDRHGPIFAGGTGLYFRALSEGLSDMPDIPQTVRDRWRYRLLEEGPSRLHAVLMREDPRTASMLRASDGQRIVRALEVLQASGRSILDWQAERGRPLVDRKTAIQLVIEADRAALVERIDRRFDRMLDNGALQEVEALLARRLDPELPAMKAIGVRELQSAIAGFIPFDAAIERAKIATRQYAKRQATWFRHQFGSEWRRISLPADADMAKIATDLVS